MSDDKPSAKPKCPPVIELCGKATLTWETSYMERFHLEKVLSRIVLLRIHTMRLQFFFL